MFYIGLINIGKTYKLINVKMLTVVDILTDKYSIKLF